MFFRVYLGIKFFNSFGDNFTSDITLALEPSRAGFIAVPGAGFIAAVLISAVLEADVLAATLEINFGAATLPATLPPAATPPYSSNPPQERPPPFCLQFLFQIHYIIQIKNFNQNVYLFIGSFFKLCFFS